MTQTFTFPSGSTVELPGGTPRCSGPKADAHGVIRCPAYNRASSVVRQRQEVAEREQILTSAVAAGRPAGPVGRLSDWLTHHRRVLDMMLERCTADPAPCTCVH